MPGSVNGIGTNLCKARGIMPWGDCDALPCFTYFYIPLVPLKTTHVFDVGEEEFIGSTSSYTYRQTPIRWSLELLFRGLALRWARVLVIIGGGMLFGAVFAWVSHLMSMKAGMVSDAGMIASFLTRYGAALALPGAATWWYLNHSDRRNIDIRYVLGPHEFGTSDPVHWRRDRLSSLPGPGATFNAASYAQAAEDSIQREDWTAAMWAARLSTAVENRATGEALTDRILHNAQLQTALAAVKQDGQQWREMMSAGKGPVALWPAPAAN